MTSRLTKTGFQITFTKPVDPILAKETKSYLVERWGYHYHPKYGSGKTNHKKESPTKVSVAKDGLSVHLEAPLETSAGIQNHTQRVQGKGRSPHGQQRRLVYLEPIGSSRSFHYYKEPLVLTRGSTRRYVRHSKSPYGKMVHPLCLLNPVA